MLHKVLIVAKLQQGWLIHGCLSAQSLMLLSILGAVLLVLSFMCYRVTCMAVTPGLSVVMQVAARLRAPTPSSATTRLRGPALLPVPVGGMIAGAV